MDQSNEVSRSTGTRENLGLFIDDSVQVYYGGHKITGVVSRTWHDVNEEHAWDDIDRSVAGAKATDMDLLRLKQTGHIPQGFVLFRPSAPDFDPILAHQSECTLLDRNLTFGDQVKKSLTSALSGTVISVQTTVSVQHCFIEPGLPEQWPPDAKVKNIPESELTLINEWNEGDFIVYKNCWMGVVDEVFEEVAVKLENESVVVVDEPLQLNIPIMAQGDTGVQNSNNVLNSSQPNESTSTRKPRIEKTIEPPANLSPGMMITTVKANLRRGRWLYGAYNPDISPVGVVVGVNATRLGITWLCQNMMVLGKFIPVMRPNNILDLSEDSSNIRRFTKSTSGFIDINGNTFTSPDRWTGGGELQLGDRVRFKDPEAIAEKYNGHVKRIPRTETLGFDVNVYVVCSTETSVRVLWQNNEETKHESRELVPYLNVDEHEVWPGETVIVRPSHSLVAFKRPGEIIDEHNGAYVNSSSETEAMWDAFKSTAQSDPTTDAPVEFMRPQKIGVVQTVDPVGRVSDVRWYESPSVELAAGIMIPGSKVGNLEETTEQVSFYESVAHQALSIRRGDYVLIAAEHAPDQVESVEQDSSSVAGADGNDDTSENSTLSDAGQFSQLVDGLRGVVDGGLLANLSAALGNHSNPQLQSLSRVLNSFPALYGNSVQPGTVPHIMPPEPEPTVDPEITDPPDWIGEVVDLGLDGLITVRLGALDDPRDVRVGIDRLHIIFNDDMDLGESEGYDDMTDDDDVSDSSDEEPEILEETIEYHGGERLDNGGDEDWLTDDDLMEIDEEVRETYPTPGEHDPVPRTPPPIPENVPPPEAISLPSNSRTPPRFSILDTPVPTDHMFANRSSATASQAFLRRVTRENKILSSSLPEGIFVRTWESRLDLIRALIVGPLNTPYELAPFVFDFHYPPTFPTDPPVGHFHSWTNGIGRVNPNLYEEGKICLSLLGTWHTENRSEGWVSSKSSVLQVLVSLMGLVLNREPWYNEAGFNVYEGSKEASLSSQLYSEKAFILSRGFVQHVLQRPVMGFEEIIDWIYLPKTEKPENEFQPGPKLLRSVIAKAKDVISRSESDDTVMPHETTDGVGRVSQGALVMLRKSVKNLEAILSSNEQS